MPKGRIQAILKMSVWCLVSFEMEQLIRWEQPGDITYGVRPVLVLPGCGTSPVCRATGGNPGSPKGSIWGWFYHSDGQMPGLRAGFTTVLLICYDFAIESPLGGTLPPHTEGSQLCHELSLLLPPLECLLPDTCGGFELN